MLINNQLGKYSYGNPTILWNVKNYKIICGKFVSIADNVTIFLGNGYGHDSTFITSYPFGYINCEIFDKAINRSKDTNGNVKIGNDVWIGNGTTIMSGVTVGDGAIIAANSHVVNNVEPYSITGGNPAKHIKYRFSSSQIEKLLQIKWWDWKEIRINKYIPLLLSANIDKFIITSLLDKTDYNIIRHDESEIRKHVNDVINDIIIYIEA